MCLVFLCYICYFPVSLVFHCFRYPFGSIKVVVVQQRCCPDGDSVPHSTLFSFSSKSQSPANTVDQVVAECDGRHVHERVGGSKRVYQMAATRECSPHKQIDIKHGFH